MSNSNKGDQNKNDLLSQIIPAVVIAILVGGTSPWWYNEFFKRPTSTPTPHPDLNGEWLNPTLNQSSKITQDGNRFRFTTWGTVEGDPFQSSGSGTITGRNFEYNYVAQYQSGRRSEGQCSGTVSAGGMRMTSTCTDSAWGTFVSSAVRQ